MVFLVGPRQTGKTTLAKSIGADFHHTVYLNWDHLPDRAIIKKQSWLPNADLLILDELHKQVLLSLNRDILRRDSKDGMDTAIVSIDKQKSIIYYSFLVEEVVTM